MFNYRQSNVIDKNTFVDEFESQSLKVDTRCDVSSEEKAFNARIADNFDRILHYDTYNKAAEVKEREQVYAQYANGVNYDLNPSSTTMQYKDMPRAEIYQDFRADVAYYPETKVRTRAKVTVIALSLIIALLSILVIFNTALLNNMNALIDNRLSEIENLQTQQLVLEKELADVSDDQAIIDAAGDIGMKF